MKCNQCKNPVRETDAICEWCGAEIIYDSQDENHPLKKLRADLQAEETRVRSILQAKVDEHNKNISAFDKIFGKQKKDLWDEELEEEFIEQVNKAQAKILNTFILPSNPNVLEQLLDMASENYKLNKPNIWSDDSEEEEESKKILSMAWYNLMKRTQKKLGLEDERGVVSKILHYISLNNGLKWFIILVLFYFFLFGIIGVMKYFNN